MFQDEAVTQWPCRDITQTCTAVSESGQVIYGQTAMVDGKNSIRFYDKYHCDHMSHNVHKFHISSIQWKISRENVYM